METHYFDINCKNGQVIQFEAIPFTYVQSLKNLSGIAVVIKNDFYGWHRLFKVQGSSLADKLLSDKVKNRIEPDNFYQSYHIAFFICSELERRSMIYNQVLAEELIFE